MYTQGLLIWYNLAINQKKKDVTMSDLKNKEFYIDKDGHKIHAKLDFPKQLKEKMPLLILAHGLTGHMEERHILGAKDAANNAGVAVLRVELYGHGKTDGKFCNHNLYEWLTELLYVIDFARDLPFVTKLFLAGHSQGGLAVILAAGMKADYIDGLIPISPATIIRDYCRDGSLFGWEFDVNNIPRRVDLWPGLDKDHDHVTDNYIRIAKNLPVEDMIDAYQGPVILIHGDNDLSVPYQCSVDANNRYKNSELVTVHGDDHCFNSHLEDMKSAISLFLGENCI